MQETWIPHIVYVSDLVIKIGLSLRVLMRKQAHSVTLAWIVVVMSVPFAGACLYLLFGENRISERRKRRIQVSLSAYRQWLHGLAERAMENWDRCTGACQPLYRHATRLTGIPALPDNELEIIEDPLGFLRRVAQDIDQAERTCHLEFYIWHPGGLVDQVAGALIRAADRGVTCRVLVDSIGSKEFLSSPMRRSMEEAGVEVAEALPAGLIRVLFNRIDIRNHRKIIVIDGNIGYTGSQNMVDPRYFKQDEGVGEWIDTMVRMRGPAVEALAGTFITDWFVENEMSVDDIRASAAVHPVAARGQAPVQLVPSGPGFDAAIHDLLLTTLYAARESIVLTTPYFVPDNPILAALKAAAQRDVEVTLIVPEKNDSRMVHYAAQARYDELAHAGVRIMLFSGGLLHAKTITVDGRFSLFGSVNLDMRSFWLNFEVTLLIYDQEFTSRLLAIQQGYMKSSREVDIEAMEARGFMPRLKENCSLLVGPLL